MKQKIKIFNDPVHGFIEIPNNEILAIIDHPYFQRLRRIRQLGLTSFVYPGAIHSRFSHSLGAYFLTTQAIDTLQKKGVKISSEEKIATQLAILLHDIGHAPFSHVLENTIIPNLSHEEIGKKIILMLNEQLNNKLELTLKIFDKKYHKKFLSQLISSQLDMDRMDYLMRDSFFTGVVEGIIGTDRIIKTLNVVADQLVVEEKGIYSVEKFLIARRLMFWQVYLHKTALAVETMLKAIFKRVSMLLKNGSQIIHNKYLHEILKASMNNKITNEIIENYIQLDDIDILFAIKQWQEANDKILSNLCKMIINRKLFKITFIPQKLTEQKIQELKTRTQKQLNLTNEEIEYYFHYEKVSNNAYVGEHQPIYILMKNGKLKELQEASDLEIITSLTKVVEKHFIAAPIYVQ